DITEHVWSILEWAIQGSNCLLINEDQLWVALEEKWYQISAETFCNLYTSVPACLEALTHHH
ncbi:hypothetical protein DL93DRAFT_2037799, partial [Clavulina sp. PMI_390]